MIVSAAGLARIASAERLRSVAVTVRGALVVGYSHTRTAKAGMAVTRGEALRLLRDDLDRLAVEIEAVLPRAVSQKVFDLVAFYAWQAGIAGLVNSKVFKELLAGRTAPSTTALTQAPRDPGGAPVPPPPGQDGGPPQQSQL